MRLLLSFVLVSLFVAVPRFADACSCVAVSPCQQVAAADAVFVGDVLEVAEPGSGGKRVTMRVVRGHKGTPKAGETVVVVMPGGSSASCSLEATVGARFVILARVRDGALSTNLCSGSYRLAPDAKPVELPAPCPSPGLACRVRGNLHASQEPAVGWGHDAPPFLALRGHPCRRARSSGRGMRA
jgi:hypothetical protein